MDENINLGFVTIKGIQSSETFFESKIDNLIEDGYSITVFSEKKSCSVNSYKHYVQWRIPKNIFLKLIYVLFGLIRLVISSPIRTSYFLTNSISSNKNIIESFKSLYINGYILVVPKLDILHFGYCTLGIGKEHLGKVMRCKLTTSFRGYDILNFPRKNQNCYDLLWHSLDKVHSISEYLYKSALELGLSKNTPYKIIYPAVDIKKFRYQKKSQNRITAPINIISVCRLTWQKGLDYALQAVQILKSESFNVCYTIIGSGPDYERLHYSCSDLGITDNVCILGKISHDQVPKLMSNNEIYLQPSVQEGFCNALIEAQSVGLLCIATSVGGIKENIVDGKTGMLIESRSPVSISDAIKRTIDMSEPDLLQLRLNARKRAEEYFDIRKQRQFFDKFFKTVL